MDKGRLTWSTVSTETFDSTGSIPAVQSVHCQEPLILSHSARKPPPLRLFMLPDTIPGSLATPGPCGPALSDLLRIQQQECL